MAQESVRYHPHLSNTKIQVQPTDRSVVKVVAVVGSVNDWAAYIGGSGYTDTHIAERGDKISESAARVLFPSFAHLEYRP